MFSDADRYAIAAAIADAETRTSGEIVAVASTRVERYPATGLTIATLLAFALPLLATVLGFGPDRISGLTGWSDGDPALDLRRAVEAYAAVQVVVFVIAAGLLVRTVLGAKLTPKALRRDRVHGEALAQFRARGIGQTRARTGVLIYVSVPDRIAEVVADAGIYAKVQPVHWAATVQALVGGIKSGRPGRGMVDAVALAGTVLAEHFPADASDNPDELPNRLIEI